MFTSAGPRCGKRKCPGRLPAPGTLTAAKEGGNRDPSLLKRKSIAELGKEVGGLSCPVVKWFVL